jgi:predicted ABC-type ATPase
MSHIYVIAGPPGVGKTTTGFSYIPADLKIINEDEIRFKYQELNYPDYKEHSIQRVGQAIRMNLIRNVDFAYELNLGYPEHYDYVLSAKKFNTENELHVIMYFTDDLELCLDRAKLRHDAGRHLVKPETVTKMYHNTIPLLKGNFHQMDSLTLIDVTSESVALVAKYEKAAKRLYLFNDRCLWFNNELYPLITRTGIQQIKPNDLNQGLFR